VISGPPETIVTVHAILSPAPLSVVVTPPLVQTAFECSRQRRSSGAHAAIAESRTEFANVGPTACVCAGAALIAGRTATRRAGNQGRRADDRHHVFHQTLRDVAPRNTA